MAMIKCFSVLIPLCQRVTHYKIICEDVKTSISSKSNSATNFNDQKEGFYLNKTIVFGVFLSRRSPWIIPSTKRKEENIDVQVARAFLSELLLTLQNDSHE